MSRGVRRGRSLVGAATGLVLLAAVPVVLGLIGGDEAARTASAPDGPAGGTGPPPGLEETLSGRLAYVAEDPVRPNGRPRLWVLDLQDGSVVEGPKVPEAAELHAAGPVNSWIVVIGSHGSDSVGYLVRDPRTSGRSAEIARGDLVSISTDGNALLVATRHDGRAAGCSEPSSSLRRIVLATFVDRIAYRGSLPCGRLAAATALGSHALVVSLDHEGKPEVDVLQPDEPPVLIPAFTHVAVSASGSLLLSDASHGDLFVWPGGGAPRAVVTGSRVSADRILTWSGDGRYVLLDGAIDGRTGTWLVDTAAGTAEPFPPQGYPLAGSLTGAAFTDDGTLLVVAPGRILASTGRALFPVSLPPGVPYPSGAVAWLP
jgi:hypothetical protein